MRTRNGSNRMLPATLVVLLFVMFGINLVVGNIVSLVSIGSRGTVIITVDVGVYWDGNCTEYVTTIGWGTIEPNYVKNVTMFVRNEGNVDVILFLDVVNWAPPEASGYMTLGWDYANQTLEPDEVFEVTLTLSVSSDIEGISNFGFDIILGSSR